MLRSSIAFVTALYAIGFAFVALAAVRWPSLLMLVSLLGDAGALADSKGQLSWRELGLSFGLVYLVAAFFFYTCSTLIGRRGRGSVAFYILGAGTGFAPFVLFEFEAGWWQNPNMFEQCVLFAGMLTLILFGAVWDLSRGRKAPQEQALPERALPEIVLDRMILPAGIKVHRRADPIEKQPHKQVRRQPVPAAIARQRACFAAYGRRDRARQVH